jgi:predicted nucleotide-binding protein (sugar kinase/HSP70/actin superfamily)
MLAINGMTRYIFAPSMVNMPTPIESETGFYCPLVQSNSYMVRMAVPMDQKSLLSPVVHLKYDPDTIALEIYDQIGGRLGVNKKKVKKAIRYALDIQGQFIKELCKTGQEILESMGKEDPVVIVTGRPYNLYDERLNLRLGKNLAKIGVSALPMDFVDTSSVDLSDFPAMYWGLGAQILRTARLIAGNQSYFGLHLTNFGCGADSFVEHFYKYIMGDKPFLILELDEHSAVAGAMTRLEAYKNVIQNSMEKRRSRSEARLEMTG